MLQGYSCGWSQELATNPTTYIVYCMDWMDPWIIIIIGGRSNKDRECVQNEPNFFHSEFSKTNMCTVSNPLWLVCTSSSLKLVFPYYSPGLHQFVIIIVTNLHWSWLPYYGAGSFSQTSAPVFFPYPRIFSLQTRVIMEHSKQAIGTIAFAN